MMDIIGIKAVLTAYTLRDLQTVSHLLQYFEGLGTPPELIRQAISESIHDSARMHRTVSRRSTAPPPSRPLCPSCGEEISLTKAEGLLIRVCQACRWSAIVEG